eukprot:760584-Hanusia_phi.AAC.1
MAKLQTMMGQRDQIETLLGLHVVLQARTLLNWLLTVVCHDRTLRPGGAMPPGRSGALTAHHAQSLSLGGCTAELLVVHRDSPAS